MPRLFARLATYLPSPTPVQNSQDSAFSSAFPCVSIGSDSTFALRFQCHQGEYFSAFYFVSLRFRCHHGEDSALGLFFDCLRGSDCRSLRFHCVRGTENAFALFSHSVILLVFFTAFGGVCV